MNNLEEPYVILLRSSNMASTCKICLQFKSLNRNFSSRQHSIMAVLPLWYIITVNILWAINSFLLRNYHIFKKDVPIPVEIKKKKFIQNRSQLKWCHVITMKVMPGAKYAIAVGVVISFVLGKKSVHRDINMILDMTDYLPQNWISFDRDIALGIKHTIKLNCRVKD